MVPKQLTLKERTESCHGTNVPFYECPCDLMQIMKMIEGLPEDQLSEIWGDLDKLEVSCPRCGKKYTVNRE